MKKHLRNLLIVFVLIIGAVILYSNYKRTQKISCLPGEYFPGCVESTPSPVPFTLKQQCSDDANKLVSNMSQIADKDWLVAHKYHTGQTDIVLNGSAFSSVLNTCVAEIDEKILQDGSVSSFDYIYDTTNDKILAQCPISNGGNCGSSSFIDTYPHGLNQNPNWADWSNYKTSIGL